MTFAFRSGTVLVIALTMLVSVASAAGTRRLVEGSPQFLEGELDGLAIDAIGQLVLAPVSTTTWTTKALHVWTLAMDRHGRVLAGTGDEGSIYRQDGDGLQLWASTLALEILCFLPEDEGVLAGSSPDGIVYRVADDGAVSVALDLPTQSVWALVAGADRGTWYAASGPGARVVRVTSSTPAGEEFLKLPATNATSVVREENSMWIGTQGPGLVYRVDGEDSRHARLVFESEEDEVRTLVGDGAGGLFVLSLATAAPAPKDEKPIVSRITWLPAGGGSEELVQSEQRLLSMARLGDGSLLVGEAETGRIFRVETDGSQSLWSELRGGEPVALLAAGEDASYIGLGGLGSVVRLRPADRGSGRLTSRVIEAPHVEQWGRLWMDGVGQGVRFQTRSGFRRVPDDTWSEWSRLASTGRTISSPAAPFLQYRVEVENSDRVTLNSIYLAYRERNLPPTIRAIKVSVAGGNLMAGGISASPPPVSQKLDEGITVEYSVYQKRDRAEPDEAAWARGIRSVGWQGEDPNGDRLRYRVEVSRLPDGDWLALAEDLDRTVYAWNTRAFEDGVYRVRVTAHDGTDNPPSQRREVNAVSAPVHVDNSPPEFRAFEVDLNRSPAVVVDVEDSSSPLVEVSARTDDGEWSPMEPDDGVLDARRERAHLTSHPSWKPGDRIWVRAVDAAGNVTLKEVRP